MDELLLTAILNTDLTVKPCCLYETVRWHKDTYRKEFSPMVDFISSVLQVQRSSRVAKKKIIIKKRENSAPVITEVSLAKNTQQGAEI